jgi:O-antigen ligase
VLIGGGFVYVLGVFGDGLGSLETPALVAVAAVVLIQMVRFADPAWLISLGIGASMFSGHWRDLGLGTTIVPDRVLIVAGVAAVLLRIGPSRERPPLELGLVHLALAAAFTFALVSMVAVQTTSDHAAVFGLIDQFGLFPFLVFAIAPTVFRTERARRILLGTLIASGAYLSLTALFEKLNVHALIWPDYIINPWVGLHFGRSRGPFAEAVANGLALYACAVAAGIAFMIWRRPAHKAFAAALCALCLVGVELTVTRAVWLGAIVGTAMVIVVARPLRRFIVPAVAGGICIVLGALALIPGLAAQAHNRQRDQSPVWERRNSNAAALRMIEARPLVGVGWYRHNASAEPFFRMNPGFPLSGERAGMHNVFLTYAVDLGIVGFGLWLLAAVLAFGGAMRGRAPPGLRPWRIGLGAVVACYIVSGVAGPLAYVYPTLLAWTWAGVAYGRRSADARDAADASAGVLGRHDLERLPGKPA